MPHTLTIAVDFDGTIVENKFPEIGKPKLFAFETLKILQEEGHRLILWTYRAEDKLDEAVQFCEERGLEFYAINKSYPEEVYEHNISRKILADIFIDDRNIGGMLGWGEIYQKLKDRAIIRENKKEKKKFGLLGRFKFNI